MVCSLAPQKWQGDGEFSLKNKTSSHTVSIQLNLNREQL